MFGGMAESVRNGGVAVGVVEKREEDKDCEDKCQDQCGELDWKYVTS